MTPATRVVRRRSTICSGSTRSPLPITGIAISRATRSIRLQSDDPVYACLAVRPWTVTAAAPASATSRATSGALISSSVQPARIFTVTGMRTARVIAPTIAAACDGSRIRLQPALCLEIFGTGQPMFTSTALAPMPSTMAAASAILAGSPPKIWMETGRSSSVYSAYSRVRSMPRTRPSELTISLTTRPQPPWRFTSRRKAVSVIPAIGATPSAGSTGREPIFMTSGPSIRGTRRRRRRLRRRLGLVGLEGLAQLVVLPLDDRLFAELLQVLRHLRAALLAEDAVGHLVAYLLELRHDGF